MRISVDLADVQVAALDELSKSDRKSRAALIRQAINDYVAKRCVLPERVMPEGEAFGLWGNNRVDGLAYQRRLRHEWKEPEKRRRRHASRIG